MIPAELFLRQAEDLAVLWGKKGACRFLAAMKANSSLGSINRKYLLARRSGKAVLILSSATRPHLKY